MKKLLFVAFLVPSISLMAVFPAFGGYDGIAPHEVSIPGQYGGGSVSPSVVAPGGTYTILCNYGYAGNGIYAVPGSGTCVYSSFSQTTAIFNCTAGTSPGTYNNSCELSNPSPYPHTADAIGSLIVNNPIVDSNLQLDANWFWVHDTGTPGTSTGTSQTVTSPALDGKSREYSMNYTSYGGQRYSLSFAQDEVSTHFVYDTWVYLANPANIQNLEMDMNQVLANGQVVIYGTQCSSVDHSWDYTLNIAGQDKWVSSNISCDPQTWTPNAWHHVQIAYERDSVGNVTYDWVNLDGTMSPFINARGNSVFDLDWTPGVLLLNFQIDGEGISGSTTVYTDKLTISRW